MDELVLSSTGTITSFVLEPCFRAGLRFLERNTTLNTENYDHISQNALAFDLALEDDFLVALAQIPSQIERERMWAGRRVNRLVTEGMAPDAACRVVIGELSVADSDESVSTHEFLEWVFVDNLTELRRWRRIAHVPEPYEALDWRIDGF